MIPKGGSGGFHFRLHPRPVKVHLTRWVIRLVVLRGRSGTPKCGTNVDQPNKYLNRHICFENFIIALLYQLPITIWHRHICFENIIAALLYQSVNRFRDVYIQSEPSTSEQGARPRPAYISLVKLSCLYLGKFLNNILDSSPSVGQRSDPTRP